ncbi:hypothetical protein [Undibacterium flavidum]|uniref:HEAT repeat protein n=1 Tax=Undibacterium flavidum TaxID=2762297 RepID=A0ABR6Y7H9_9BURK|nr:hypothetical protein [Undibacterium flavidum]MBC3872549.1 hypothetical protein [Undibacterium flavidum]
MNSQKKIIWKFGFKVICVVSLGFATFSSSNALACSVVFYDTRGFQSSHHLPANARGVLFRWEAAEVAHIGNARIVNKLPVPLSAKQFAVSESDRLTPISVVIKKVELPSNNKSDDKYFYIADPELKACFDTRNLGSQSETCAAPEMRIANGDDIAKFLDQGKIRDVSIEFQRENGLFRIEPVLGFNEGKRYKFKFIDEVHQSHMSSNNTEAEVEIDAPLLLSAADRLTLESDLVPTLSWRGDGFGLSSACGDGIRPHPIFQKEIEFHLPQAFAPYRKFMYFRSEELTTQSELSVPAAPLRTVASASDLSLLNQAIVQHIDGFLQTRNGSSKVFAHALCSARAHATPRTISLRGYTALLEMGDTLLTSAPIEINFLGAADNICYGAPLLERVLAENAAPQITAAVCDLTAGPFRDVDPVQILTLLHRVPITNTPNGNDERRFCLADALVHTASQIKDLDSASAERVFSQLLSLTGKSVDGDSSNLDDIRKFSNQLQSRINAASKDSDLDASVFSSTAKILAKRYVAYGRTNSNEDFSLARTLKGMGVSAQDAIPVLLGSLDNVTTSPPWEIFRVMLAIAPKDHRVIAATLDASDKNRDAKSALTRIKVETINNAETLLLIAEKSPYDDQRKTAFQLLFKKPEYSHRVSLALMSLAFQDKRDVQNRELIARLRKLKNDDQRCIEIFFSVPGFSDEKTWWLKQMGSRAAISAPRLLKEFSMWNDAVYYFNLIDTLKVIDVTKRSLRKAYQIARQSEVAEIRDAAKSGLVELNAGRRK